MGEETPAKSAELALHSWNPMSLGQKHQKPKWEKRKITEQADEIAADHLEGKEQKDET